MFNNNLGFKLRTEKKPDYFGKKEIQFICCLGVRKK